MLWNYFVIGWRNLVRRGFFTFINITGLAVAMAFSILIFLWIRDELKVDQFHANKDRLYRVLQSQYYEDGKIKISDQTSALLVSALKEQMPEVERAVMISEVDRWTFKVGDKLSKEQGCHASEDMFLMFSFPFISGDPKNCLTSEDQIVISQKLALKYFGTQNPLGKSIRLANVKDYYVSGVFEDIPRHSSLQFDFLLSYKEYENLPWAKDWTAIGDKVFLLLRENALSEDLNKKIKHFLNKKIAATTDQLSLQPYTDIYLYSDFQNGIQNGGRIDYVRIFSFVAILILIVACINFMNLATAQSVKRSREIGIRKVAGASRSLLVRQFLIEAILTAMISAVVSLLLVEVGAPSFESLTGKNISLNYSDPSFISAVVVLVLVTGIVAGLYPAIFLSSLQPVKILKGALKFKPGAIDLRKTLVVFQFSLAIIFILSTLVVYEQLQYIRTKNLGLDREHLIYQTFGGDLVNNLSAFKAELSQSAGIQSVTYSNQPVLAISNPTTWIDWPGKKTEMVFTFAGVGYDYCKTMKIQLVEGRDFSPEVAGDSSNVLINEEALRQMGIKDPIGHEISTRREMVRKGKVIGVMKNFHLQSLHTPIEPLCLFLNTYPGFGYITVRAEAGKTKQALASMASANKKYNPHFPFEYTFADEDFKSKYVSEEVLADLAKAFSCFAILISCLGLFGLAAFTAEQRTKEIGIRKVLGATVSNIVQLLSYDFIKLVLIAFLLAVPATWYGMQHWLEGYAYRVNVSLWMIGVAGATSLLIAIFTVSSQALRAALKNPVESLKTE